MDKNYMPRYIQIQNYIKEQINNGNWKQGDLLPTELELAKMFEVSRITVTTALRELVKDGIIYRVQGKGTYVARTKYELDVYKLVNLSIAENVDPLKSSGVHKNISIKEEIPSSKIAAILKSDKGKSVIAIEKLKYVSDIPFSIETFYLPCDLYPGILEKDIENMYLIDLIKKEYKISFEKSILYSEPILCDKRTSKLLEVPLGAPMLYSVMEFYGDNGNPIGCMVAILRGDRAKYVMRHTETLS